MKIVFEFLCDEIEINIVMIDESLKLYFGIVMVGEELLREICKLELNVVLIEFFGEVFFGGYIMDYFMSVLIFVLD